MINFDDVTTENIKEHNPSWPQISDHSYRILMIGRPESGKTNSLFNLINEQPDVDKVYLYAKDPYESKYQFSINKRESTGLMHFNDFKALLNTQITWMIFIKTLKNKTQIKKRKILIVFDDMIADILSNKKLI